MSNSSESHYDENGKYNPNRTQGEGPTAPAPAPAEVGEAGESGPDAVLVMNLQHALISHGHDADCPVVHGASVDCVPGTCHRAAPSQSEGSPAPAAPLAPAPGDGWDAYTRAIRLLESLKERLDYLEHHGMYTDAMERDHRRISEFLMAESKRPTPIASPLEVREAGFVDLSGLIWIFFIGVGIALVAGVGLTYLGQWFFKHFSWSWA